MVAKLANIFISYKIEFIYPILIEFIYSTVNRTKLDIFLKKIARMWKSISENEFFGCTRARFYSHGHDTPSVVKCLLFISSHTQTSTLTQPFKKNL